jgi:transcriptional regulator with XRE-family HTH domain
VVVVARVGERIKGLRQSKNLSQDDIAKIIGAKNRSTIANYEAERISPDFEAIEKLAIYFNVTTDYIFGLTDDPIKKAEVAFELTDGRVITDINKMFAELGPSDQKLIIDMFLSLKEKDKQ